MAIIVALIQTVGLWFLIAVALEFVASYSEQMGAAYKPPEEEKRGEGFGEFALMLVTTLTPGLLFVHAFLATAGEGLMQWGAVRLWAIGLIVAAMLVGAIAGRLVGGAWPGAARVMRTLALPLGLVAFVFALYATWPSLLTLIALLSGDGIVLPVRLN
jgi:hypothetical protein